MGVINIIRVIAGKAKGYRLKTVKGMNTRPTTDMAKEGLFNTLAPYIPEKSILDLYAGTGSLAIEALSRGAQKAVLVEKNPEAFSIIRQNLEKTNFTKNAAVLGMDVFAALKKLSHSIEKFDIIFLDPPYGSGLIDKTLRCIIEYGLLAENGIIVAESDRHDESEKGKTGLKAFKEKFYGRTAFSFYGNDCLRPGEGEKV